MQAIALPSRLRMLRLLAERRRTVTELAKGARLTKSTAHDHLHGLERVGLVTRHDEGRMWIYYTLTPTGRIVASSNPMRLVVTVTLSIAALAGSAIAFLAWRARQPPPEEPWWMPPIGGEEPPAPEAEPWLALAAAGLVLAAGTLSAWWMWRRRRRERASPDAS